VLDGEDAQVVGRNVWLPARLVQVCQVAVTVALAAATLWLLVSPALG
jgi:hypothetical protein